jgi:osmotically-inducible protein OsmY
MKPVLKEETLKSNTRDVARAAREMLAAAPLSSLRQIGCDCRDGSLVLTGSVSTWYHKQLAQVLVRSVEGVTRIDNQLRVERS